MEVAASAPMSQRRDLAAQHASLIELGNCPADKDGHADKIARIDTKRENCWRERLASARQKPTNRAGSVGTIASRLAGRNSSKNHGRTRLVMIMHPCFDRHLENGKFVALQQIGHVRRCRSFHQSSSYSARLYVDMTGACRRSHAPLRRSR